MLSDDSSNDEKNAPVFEKVSWNTESEDDGLAGTLVSPVDVTERPSSSKKKSKNA